MTWWGMLAIAVGLGIAFLRDWDASETLQAWREKRTKKNPDEGAR